MTAERVERKLSAILAADVAGYSRLMGADEEGTLAALNAHRRDLFEPVVANHRGRIVKTTGDGFLVAFSSVVDAVRCAVAVQVGMADRNDGVGADRALVFRIGINVGDIVEQDGDIFGDGVNIAARLEGIAEPGGICVSGRVQEDAAGRVDVAFDDIGEQSLKNIARPVRVYRVRPTNRAAQQVRGTVPAAATPAGAGATSDRPALAVLPFQNMSGDAEQEYFADGVVEEIITALSRFRSFAVIARNSSFVYKGRAVDVRQAGKELGVRYVLEGSVRRAGDKLRITAQLVETATGEHIWADRFDGSVADIFDVQDRITESVATIVEPKIRIAETERAKRERPGNLTAYDLYLQAMSLRHFGSQNENATAFGLLQKAMALDPTNATIASFSAVVVQHRFVTGWPPFTTNDREFCRGLIQTALAATRDDAIVLARCGNALVQVMHEYDLGLSTTERAVELNPNDAEVNIVAGVNNLQCGSVERALGFFERVMRLSPSDPYAFTTLTGISHARMVQGDFAEALRAAERSLTVNPSYDPTYWMLIAANAHLVRMEEAHRWLAQFRALSPSVTIATISAGQADRDGTRMAAILEGLRLAGLPD